METIRELYNDAIEHEEESLLLLLDFLLLEKQALKWDHDTEQLERYFLPKNKDRMNKLLLEYKEANKNVDDEC